MNIVKILLSILILVAFSGCQQNATDVNSNATSSPSINPDGVEMRTDFPHIPIAEKGITLVSEHGWEENTMNFHVGYCEQMFSNTADVDGAKFCPCFLDKIQYYYEPIYFKEAYEDQAHWNSICLAESKLVE